PSRPGVPGRTPDGAPRERPRASRCRAGRRAPGSRPRSERPPAGHRAGQRRPSRNAGCRRLRSAGPRRSLASPPKIGDQLAVWHAPAGGVSSRTDVVTTADTVSRPAPSVVAGGSRAKAGRSDRGHADRRHAARVVRGGAPMAHEEIRPERMYKATHAPFSLATKARGSTVLHVSGQVAQGPDGVTVGRDNIERQ